MKANKKKQLTPDYLNHKRTIETKTAIDENGNPVPWITYPAILYLKQIDFSECSVFEYGAGASTRFWSRHAKKVVSVEHDEQWASKIGALALPNVELVHATGDSYVAACDRGAPHDVIVIDGRWRYDCAMTCLRALSPAGMVILDNSERYPAITRHFRDKGFIEVDLIGPGPINRFFWATSIFLSRSITLKPAKSIQPHNLAGMTDSFETNAQMADVNLPGSF